MAARGKAAKAGPRRGRWRARRRPSELAALIEPGAHWKHKIVSTAARLDLFSMLSDGPRSANAIAKRRQGDARAFEVLLNALAALGLLVKRQGRFANSAFAARHLVRGAKDYRADQLVVDDLCWELWGKLEPSLLSGRPALAGSLFRDHPEAAERLILGLHHDALRFAPKLAQRLPLRDRAALLDVGGGAGTYSIAFCRRYPKLKATIVDLPLVAPIARAMVARHRMGGRIRVVEGDILRDHIPGRHDTVFISNVVHSYAGEEVAAIFRKARECLSPGGVIIVRDVIMEEGLTAPEWGAVFAVNMLLHTPRGRCYSFRGIASLLTAAGFTGVKELVSGEVVIARTMPR